MWGEGVGGGGRRVIGEKRAAMKPGVAKNNNGKKRKPPNCQCCGQEGECVQEAESEEIEEEDDPRAELVRRLLEYERYRSVSEEIDQLNRVERDIYLSLST